MSEKLYLTAVYLLHKMFFQMSSIQVLKSNLPFVYKMLEKVKIQRYCKPFAKILFDCIFFGCYCYCHSICLFALARTIKLFVCIP